MLTNALSWPIHDTGCTLTQIAVSLDLPTSTTHRLLQELQTAQMTTKDKAAVYKLETIEIPQKNDLLSKKLKPLLERISFKTGDASFLVVEKDAHSICIERAVGTYPIQALTIPVGNRQPLGVGAGGLAMLSEKKDEEIDAHLEKIRKDLKKYNQLSIKKMRRLIADSRKNKFAIIGNYAALNVTGIGVAVKNQTGKIIGGISVATINQRLSSDHAALIKKVLRDEITNFMLK